MQKSMITKIENEIDKKTKLSKDVKDKIRGEIALNIGISIVIISYFIFIVLGSIGTIKNVRTVDLNILSFMLLLVSIILFEVAYRKDNGKLGLFGFEFLVIATLTLFLPYIMFELDEVHKKYYLLSSIYIAIYYIVKSIYISIRIRNQYMKNISDIKELVKKEKKNNQNNKLDEMKVERERARKVEKSND